MTFLPPCPDGDADPAASGVWRSRSEPPLSPLAAHLLEFLDRYHPATAAHSRRVADLCALVAGPSYYEPALVHDCGKIDPCVRALLDLPRRLTPHERREVELHPLLGVALLEIQASWTEVPALYYEVVQSHHERWDGTGYPDGLQGNQIPLGARLCAVADSFDAMVTARPYRIPLTVEAACAELRQGAGSQFDPSLVEPVIVVLQDWAPLEETA